jgi:hypothetical protein
MLDGLKRLFGATPEQPAHDWDGIAPWAAGKQYTFRAVGTEGFVIDGRLSTTAWRLEWGPSQRPYITGQELRIRAELGLGSDLQVVVMSRELAEAMEKAVFDQYVEGVQTRIDNQTPPEMRWLVMFPKLGGAEMPQLREKFVALASVKPWLTQWLEGPLTAALGAARIEPGRAFVLMLGRGRLMLRTAMPDADIGGVQGWLRCFETAVREAQRVGAEHSDSAAQQSQNSGWSPSALPGDERKT